MNELEMILEGINKRLDADEQEMNWIYSQVINQIEELENKLGE